MRLSKALATRMATIVLSMPAAVDAALDLCCGATGLNFAPGRFRGVVDALKFFLDALNLVERGENVVGVQLVVTLVRQAVKAHVARLQRSCGLCRTRPVLVERRPLLNACGQAFLQRDL